LKPYKLIKTKSGKRRLVFSSSYFELLINQKPFVYWLVINKLVKDLKSLCVEVFIDSEQEMKFNEKLNEDKKFMSKLSFIDFKIMEHFKEGFLNSKICDIDVSLKEVNRFLTMLENNYNEIV